MDCVTTLHRTHSTSQTEERRPLSGTPMSEVQGLEWGTNLHRVAQMPRDHPVSVGMSRRLVRAEQ